MSEEQESGISGQGSENKESVVSDQKQQDERLLMISKTIKAMAAMSQVGMTYCIVIPGHGVREDCRLGSNYIAPPHDRSESSVMNEVCGNIETILESHMRTLQHMGISSDAITGMIDAIVRKAKERFEESSKGLGEGAGPQ